MLMAAARLDLSSVFLYAGSILPGIAKMSDGSERTVTIIDASIPLPAPVPRRAARTPTPSSARSALVKASAWLYTANTMASVAEAIGMSLPGPAAPPAT